MKTILSTIAVLSLSLGASAAFACEGTPPPNCQCDKTTNTWVQNVTTNNNTTNNIVNGINGSVSAASGSTSSATGGTSSAVATGGTNSNVVNAAGGQGGQGGAGGQGGTASATGGSVSGSGNSTNTNNVTGGNSSANIAAGAVKNSNSQKQNQSQSVSNSGNSTIASGAVQNTVSGGSASIAAGAVVNNTTTSANGNGSGNSLSTGASTSAASANGAGANSNNTNITSNYSAPRIPVATAYAASLTSGMDTCLGSASGAVQIPVVGISIGGTKQDKHCVRIKDVHLVMELGRIDVACVLARQGKEGADINEAFNKLGAECVPLAPVVVTKEVVKEVPGPTVTIYKEVPAETKIGE